MYYVTVFLNIKPIIVHKHLWLMILMHYIQYSFMMQMIFNFVDMILKSYYIQISLQNW